MNSAKVYALILARIFGVYYCFYFYNGDLGMFLTDFHAFLNFVNIIDNQTDFFKITFAFEPTEDNKSLFGGTGPANNLNNVPVIVATV